MNSFVSIVIIPTLLTFGLELAAGVFIAGVGNVNSESWTLSAFGSPKSVSVFAETTSESEYPPAALTTANELAHILLGRVEQYHQSKLISFDTSGRAGLIPPDLLPPIVPFQPETYNFSSVLLNGYYEQHDTELHGLDALTDDLVVDISQESALVLNYTVVLPLVVLKGNFSADFTLNLTYLGEVIPNLPIVIDPEEGLEVPIEGAGGYELSATHVRVNISLKLNIVNDMVDSVRTSADFDIETISILYDNAKFNGEGITEGLWKYFSDLFQVAIRQLWNEKLQTTVEELLNDVFTELFHDCRYTDLIEGDYSCTGLVSPPETSEPPSTTSTRPPDTTTTEPDTTTTEPDQCSASSSPCAPGTYCETGQEAPFCRCSDQLYAIADYRVNQIQCRRVDGASCLLDFKDPEYHSCVTNAFCYAENTTHGRCRCGAGFLRAEDGSCAGDLAQECGAPFQECYEPFMLECRNRKCECASPSLVYEAGLGCLAQVGEPCHIYNKIERQYRIQCASGLECAQTSVGRHVCQEASGASSVISFKLMLFLSVFAAMLSFSARSQ